MKYLIEWRLPLLFGLTDWWGHVSHGASVAHVLTSVCVTTFVAWYVPRVYRKYRVQQHVTIVRYYNN